MASNIKTISDALIALLASEVAELNERTVATFSGSAAELAAGGRNLPFVGITLESARYGYLNAEESLVREDLTFNLIILVEDFRGTGYSVETGYGLLDDIRDSLLGARLGIDGLAPLRIGNFSMSNISEKEGLALFSTSVDTWQVRQSSVA